MWIGFFWNLLRSVYSDIFWEKTNQPQKSSWSEQSIVQKAFRIIRLVQK